MLTVHRSESGLALVAGLAELFAVPPADPFTPEVVAVPAPGIERWLAQRLSHDLGADASAGAVGDDGVCANVLFPRPSQMLDAAVSAVSPEHARAVEVWAPERTTWVLVDLLEEVATALVPLEGRARAPPPPPRCRRPHRPPVRARPPGRRAAAPVRGLAARRAAGRARDEVDVPADLRWQPLLWRRLREELGPGPAELLPDALTGLVAHPEKVRLPSRVSVYGASRLDTSRLSVLAALAQQREVHLWLNHASPALWETLATRGAPPDLRRRAVPTPAGTPLLASLSRDVQELQQRLAHAVPGHHDLHHAQVRAPDDSLLRRLQRSLHDDALPTRTTGRPSRGRTGRCRCTPATAAPVRSRCCATSCSACSPTTPPSSRATCW